MFSHLKFSHPLQSGAAHSVRLRLHWSQNQHNTANQHLSGYPLHECVATFNPTCVSRFTATQWRLVLSRWSHLIVWVVGSLQHSRILSTLSTAISIHVRSLLRGRILYHEAFSFLSDLQVSSQIRGSRQSRTNVSGRAFSRSSRGANDVRNAFKA